MTATIIPMNEPKPKPRKCSFCGKQEQHATRFFSNNVPDAERCICGDCVLQAKQRCQEVTE